MRTAKHIDYESAPGGRASRTGSASETHLHGRWLLLARFAGGVLLVFNLTVFVIGLPLYFAHYQAVCSGMTCAPWQLTPQSVKTLQGLGLSATGYATVCLLLGVVAVVVSCAIAGLIIFRKPDNWMGLLIAFLLVMQSTNYLTADVAVLSPLFGPMLAEAVSKCFNFLMTVTEMLVFCLFPNGRFAPRWTRWLMVAFLAGALFTLAVPPAAPSSGHDLLRFLVLWGSFLISVSVAQLYRYRQVSSPVERQQTKWVVYGLGWQIVIGSGIISLPYLFPSLMQASSLYDLVTYLAVTFCSSLFFALCFGIAILHYRLYDIDVLINRTLVYALLTASTLGLYVLVVFGASSLLRAYNDLFFSLLATALIAVLFQPLRQWLQHGVNHLMFGERNEPYRVLSRLGQRLEETLPADTVLPTVAETVARALKLPYVAIVCKREQVPVGAETLLLTAAFGTSSGSAAETWVPLVHQGKHLGELVLSSRQRGEALTPADLRLVRDLAPQIGMALHSALLLADLQQARERLITTREEERRRLRRDLHDGLGPALASLTFKVDAARNLLTQDSARVDRLLGEVRQQAQEAITDIRQLVYNLRPPALDELGLLSALREQAAHYQHQGLEVDFEAPQALPPLPAAIEVAVYRIAQEALTNIAHHADARHCLLHLSINTQIFHLDISDDGQGIAAGHHVGVGLHAMHERASELGGSCTIAPGTSGGTLIQVRLPLVTVREALPTSAQEPGQLEQE